MEEDLVKREDVISALASCGCTGEQMAAIRNVPAAVTKKTEHSGTWHREMTCRVPRLYRYECSECGMENEGPDNYCPNCGAYMRETEG